MLKDQFGRQHNYLRISLTDQCNFRCLYCMPDEHYEFMPPQHLLNAEEIESLAEKFIGLGVNKIRLTGGEPLVRKDFRDVLGRLADLPVSLSITTNGVLIDKYFDDFHRAGLKSLNISLDTLQKEKFEAITKRKVFDRVWKNVMKALKEGFRVKLNVVAMHGINEDEIGDFVELLADYPFDVRFIEFMPFDGNQWHLDKVLTYKEIIEYVHSKYDLIKLDDPSHSTSRTYRIKGFKGSLGVIATVTEPFCSSCNRLRITADGKMRNCLFANDEIDLLTAMRAGEDIIPLIQTSVKIKSFKIGGLPEFQNEDEVLKKLSTRSMIKIGG